MLMRTISIPLPRDEAPFDYYCPVCGADLAESNYETFDAEYFCPVCSTQLRPSKVPARQR
jgi:rubredoxin